MNYRLLDQVKTITESDRLDRYKVDDLLELFVPIVLESAYDNAVVQEKMQDAADEGWRQGNSDGFTEANDETRMIIHEMLKEGWDSDTLLELRDRIW